MIIFCAELTYDILSKNIHVVFIRGWPAVIGGCTGRLKVGRGGLCTDTGRGCLGRARRWDSGLFGRARRASEDETIGVYCQAAKTDQADREQVTYSQSHYLTTANNKKCHHGNWIFEWEPRRTPCHWSSQLFGSPQGATSYCYDKIFVYSRCHYISFVHDL